MYLLYFILHNLSKYCNIYWVHWLWVILPSIHVCLYILELSKVKAWRFECCWVDSETPLTDLYYTVRQKMRFCWARVRLAAPLMSQTCQFQHFPVCLSSRSISSADTGSRRRSTGRQEACWWCVHRRIQERSALMFTCLFCSHTFTLEKESVFSSRWPAMITPPTSFTKRLSAWFPRLFPILGILFTWFIWQSFPAFLPFRCGGPSVFYGVRCRFTLVGLIPIWRPAENREATCESDILQRSGLQTDLQLRFRASALDGGARREQHVQPLPFPYLAGYKSVCLISQTLDCVQACFRTDRNKTAY